VNAGAGPLSNLTKEQIHLLREIVGIYKSGITSDFMVVRNVSGHAALGYDHPPGYSVKISAEDGDFYQLRDERLIKLYHGVGMLRGSPTQRGITAIEELNAVATNTTPSGTGEVAVSDSPAPDAGTPTPADRGEQRSIEVDLERLIEGKEAVDLPTAARYLERSRDHVRRLVRKKKLRRLGQGRPIKVSTASLRKYKRA
jgi:hypothetical protein